MIRNIVFAGLMVSSSAFAVKSQCIQGVDWLPFCAAPDAPGTRCTLASSNTWATSFCAPETVGCAEVGGCFGDIPPGYWYPFIENGQVYKCRCGCVAADETNFETSLGNLSGRDLIRSKLNSELKVSSVDSLNSPWVTSDKAINSIMLAPSKEKSFRIETRSGRSVIASPGHPVLIASSAGLPVLMKKASDVRIGEFVLTHNGEADEVVSKKDIEYKGELVNFNVRSSRSEEHVVPMNGIMLGDYAWQERLNSRDARILLRSEVARELQSKKDSL